jgi:uncharacterized membrane protein
MAAAGFTRRHYRIDAQTRGDVLERRNARGRVNWQAGTSGKAHYNDLMLALRYVYLIALVIWLGGMVILGAIVAPTTFQVLQASAPDVGRALAGELFGVMLHRFHYVAYSSGAVLFVTLGIMAILGPRPASFAIRMAIIATMLGVALYSGFVVLTEIDAIQREVGTLPSRLAATDPRRLRFDHLHVLSTRLMTFNIVAAVALLYWEAREHIR